MCVCVCVCVRNRFSCVQLFVILWTVACPWDSPGKNKYWSGLPCPSPGDLPNPGIEPESLMSPASAGRFFTTSTIWEAQRVKSLPAMWETQVWSLGREGPLEKGIATHYSILTWRIPWIEEPGGLQSTGSQRVGRDWITNTFSFTSYTQNSHDINIRNFHIHKNT